MEIIGKDYAFQRFGDKISSDFISLRGMITVCYEFKKIHGPRSTYAKVVIFASGSEEFCFKSEVVWKSENYTKAIVNGLLDVLVKAKPNPILNGNFIFRAYASSILTKGCFSC